MFRRLPETEARPDVAFTYEGESVLAKAGDSVACALLAVGILVCRTTTVSGAPRAPYCLMGVCYECLVTIDGRGNQQGCMVEIRAGMRIEAQGGRLATFADPVPANNLPRETGE